MNLLEQIGWLFLLVLLMPVVVYSCMKLGTLGVLVARKRFNEMERNENHGDSEGT